VLIFSTQSATTLSLPSPTARLNGNEMATNTLAIVYLIFSFFSLFVFGFVFSP
jgi:hypothetical protein